MKKYLALLLAMLMLLSMVACGGQPVTDGSETQPTESSGNTNTPNSDSEDLDGILLVMTAEGKTAIDTVTANSETLLEKLGDSYSTYDANKTAVTEFYNSTSAQASELYTSFYTASINYFKCVAAQGLEDYDEWNDAMEEFYEEWDDTMSDYYDAWNDAYEEIYDLCDDVISEASDELDYSVYSDAWSDMNDEYSEAWEAMYDAHSEAWEQTYDDYSDVWDGFYDGKTDVNAILEEMYDVLYDGVLKDQPDGVKYADWSGHRSNEYKQWSGTRSDAYDQRSDFRSDVYSFWTDTRSELYKDDLDGAKDEIGDFRKDVEKLQGKVASNDEESTTEPTETASDETQNEVSSPNGIRTEFKEAMDSYEKFFDEYVAFMQKYKDNGYPISMLNDYAKLSMPL